MTHYYDSYGWHTDVPNPDRNAGIAPPTCANGERPNWTGHAWVCAVYTAPPEPVAPPAPPRYISVGSFFDRFGADKWPILASTDPLVQALVKDCTVRIAQGINLDRPDVAGGVALLSSKGFTNVTAAVITDPIQESEKP